MNTFLTSIYLKGNLIIMAYDIKYDQLPTDLNTVAEHIKNSILTWIGTLLTIGIVLAILVIITSSVFYIFSKNDRKKEEAHSWRNKTATGLIILLLARAIVFLIMSVLGVQGV